MRWDCFLIRRRLSRYLDGELSDRRAARIERHLAGCAACQAELDACHRAVQFVRTPRSVEPPAEGWSEIADQLEAKGVPGFASPTRPTLKEDPSPAPVPSFPFGGFWRAAVAAAAVLVVAALTLPQVTDMFAPPAVLAHSVDLPSFMGDLREDRLGEMTPFGRTYRIHQVEANRAADSCPSGKNPPMELPAGYLLTRAMSFQADCCPGLALEYRRGDSRVTILQIAGHHPLEWGGVDHEDRQIGMEHYQVHEEKGLHTLVRTGGPVNLMVAGDPPPEVLSEIASFLAARVEAAMEAKGMSSRR